MANTYTQIFIQFVIVVKFRKAQINPSWEDALQRYISGIVERRRHKLIAINGTEDHLHVFVGFKPVESMSDLMMHLKSDSAKWINDNRLTNDTFRWQEGYGAFSYAQSQVSTVYNYVMRQKEHHRKRTFLEEYLLLLKKFGVEFDDRYIFKP